MSQQSGEKTEQPTPKKLRDARKKGQVPRSQEVVSAASLFAVIGYLWWGFANVFEDMIVLMDTSARIAASNPGNAGYDAVAHVYRSIALTLIPVVLLVIVIGIFSNFIQFGFLIAFEAIKPKIENIGINKGVKRIFSKRQLVEILKSIVKITLLSTLLFVVIREYLGAAVSSLTCGLPCITAITVEMLRAILICAVIAFAFIAAADLAYQRRAHTKSLMMTKNEVKREYKESEGDPLIKSSRRQFAQEMLMSDAGEATRKSSAVIVNPTHFAVAIQYEPDKFPLPWVRAKGRNAMAAFVRSEAEKAGVPIFLNPQLARSLYALVDVNQPIPNQMFKPIAEILVWVSHHRDLLYKGPLDHGVLDMQRGEHRLEGGAEQSPAGGPPAPRRS